MSAGLAEAQATQAGGLPWQHDDGGRAAAGFGGATRDCVTRAISVATGKPYREVYDALNALAENERPRRGGRRSSARTGVHRRTWAHYLEALGWRWVGCCKIGQRQKVHLRPGELPSAGRLVVFCSKHLCAVVDGVVRDTHDPCRGGTRMVYGYYVEAQNGR